MKLSKVRVLAAIRNRPGITVEQLMAEFNATYLSITQHLLRLSAAKMIENRGSTKGLPGQCGRWHIVEAPPPRPRAVASVWDLASAP